MVKLGFLAREQCFFAETKQPRGFSFLVFAKGINIPNAL